MTSDALARPRRLDPRSLLIRSNEIGLLLIIGLFWLIFALFSSNFFSVLNLYSMTRIVAVDILIGFSMMVVLAVGGMNLAVGSIGVCGAMAAGWLMEVQGLPVPVGILGGLAVGALLGFANGFTVVRSGVSSFIVTLGSMSVFFGVMIVLTGAEAFRNLPAGFTDFSRIRVLGWVSGMLLVSLAVGILLIVLFRFTALGRQFLATGANPKAAELSGVPVRRVVILAHLLSGLLAAAAGLLVSTRNGAALTGLAGQIGQDWLLPAFLAPVLGGTLLAGGAVSVTGTMLGALLVITLNTGLRMVNVGDFWIELFLGLILLAAVMIDRGRSVWAARRGARAA
jgi:ribose transport system permease protein